MINANIILFVESSKRHNWLEGLASNLAKSVYSQHLVTVEPDGDEHTYFKENYTNFKNSSPRSRKLSPFRTLFELRDSFDPALQNIVVTFGHYPSALVLFASYFLDFKFIFYHMQQPKYFELMKPKWRGKFHNFIYKLYSHKCDRVISLSLEVREQLTKFNVSQSKIMDIFIGVDFLSLKSKLTSLDDNFGKFMENKKILMVGRLAQEKNYPLAIQSFANFLRYHPKL